MMLFLIALAQRYIGTTGTLLISFLGGLFELQGLTLATSLLYIEDHLSLALAGSLITTAIMASFVSKLVIVWILTPRYFAIWLSAFILIILASGSIAYWIIM